MPGLYHCPVAPRTPTVLITRDKRSGWIRTSSSTAIPTVFQAFVDDPIQPFTLDLEVRTRGGRRPEVTNLVLEVRNLSDSRPITTEALREVQVASALKLALARATKAVVDQGDGTFTFPDDTSGAAWGGRQVARPVRGVPMTDEFLKRVADTYRGRGERISESG